MASTCCMQRFRVPSRPSCDRRLNMRSGTLDREILWETPAGKQALISSRRLVSFVNRHVAAISDCVTLLNAEASVVISSEMRTNGPSTRVNGDDPRQARAFSGRVLHQQTGYSKDRHIVLCHATEKSRLILTCAMTACVATAVLALTTLVAHAQTPSGEVINRLLRLANRWGRPGGPIRAARPEDLGRRCQCPWRTARSAGQAHLLR
jgi:Glycosyl hydrolase family 65, N-terminal domain